MPVSTNENMFRKRKLLFRQSIENVDQLRCLDNLIEYD